MRINDVVFLYFYRTRVRNNRKQTHKMDLEITSKVARWQIKIPNSNLLGIGVEFSVFCFDFLSNGFRTVIERLSKAC